MSCVYIRGKGSIKDYDKVLSYDFYTFFIFVDNLKDEKQKGRPGYEHLNEPLHILIEADLPPCVVDLRPRQAHEIIQELLKAIVSFLLIINSLSLFHYFKSNLFFYSFDTLSFYFWCIYWCSCHFLKLKVVFWAQDLTHGSFHLLWILKLNWLCFKFKMNILSCYLFLLFLQVLFKIIYIYTPKNLKMLVKYWIWKIVHLI